MRSPATRTILVANDSPAITDRFVAALEGAGHRAVTAGTARELLDRVGEPEPGVDLIILDLGLPGGNGVDLVRALRESRGGRSVPLLAFSGTVASAREVRDLADLGVAGYVNEHSAVQHIVPSVAPHLFPDSFNRRSGPRVPLGVPVQYRVGNTIGAAVTLDVGSGGVAIRTTSPLETGSRIGVRFRIPGSRRDVEAEGRVSWSDRRVGMGVQFEQVEPAGQAAIDDFVEAHGRARRT
jgi:uncharacterized protein (TIGR02266 family)